MILLLILFNFISVNCQPCSDVNSVDITDGEVHSGTVLKDGVLYPSDFVFAKNVSGEVKTFGCLCEVKNCFRKCCPVGTVMRARQCVASTEADQLQNNGIDLHFFNSFKKNVRLNSSQFVLVDGKPCDGMYREIEKWYVQTVSWFFN